MYDRALQGIRATRRGQFPIKPRDPFLLRDASTILADCGIRPEECFGLRWENVPGDVIEMSTTKQYVHLQLENTRLAIERARAS